MCFQLAPKSMTLDDLELLQVQIFSNFATSDLVSCVLYTKAVARLPLY